MDGSERNYQTGDVFQVVRKQYEGALVYLVALHEGGIVAVVANHGRGGSVWFKRLRLAWNDVEFIGTPKFVPEF